MRILTVTYSDHGGGADIVARNLSRGYRRNGLSAWMAVGRKYSSDRHVYEFSDLNRTSFAKRPFWSLHGRLADRDEGRGKIHIVREWLARLGNGKASIDRYLGHEVFPRHTERDLLNACPINPDIIHGHTLHGEYFGLDALPILSHQLPFVLTLHDIWMITGHCAHSLDCERWRTGCGNCPYLGLYPSVRRDATAYNWRRKNRIYDKSKLFIATPSQWLMDKLEQSILYPAVQDARVIPNGVDLTVFKNGNTQDARGKLGLPNDDLIVLFTANSIRENPWKDFNAMRIVIERLSHMVKSKSITFVALGDDGPKSRIGSANLVFVPFQDDVEVVAQYYQSADIYLHAAKVDTFPNTVLEAMACARPIVASAVGGIPEQIEDGKTGFLSPPGNVELMTSRLECLITNNDLRYQLGEEAARSAKEKFSLDLQVDRYLEWYKEIIEWF